MAYQLTAALSCIWPNTEVKEHPASLRMICGQHAESPVTVGFIDWAYRYHSVPTQIITLLSWHRSHTLVENSYLTRNGTSPQSVVRIQSSTP